VENNCIEENHTQCTYWGDERIDGTIYGAVTKIYSAMLFMDYRFLFRSSTEFF
jgi:hypothetical protein